MITLRYPVRLLAGRHLTGDFSNRVTICGHEAKITEEGDGAYVVLIDGLESVESAEALVHVIYRAMCCAMVDLSIPFEAPNSLTPLKPLPDGLTPEQAARNLEKSMGLVYMGPIHGWEDWQNASAFPTGNRILFSAAGSVTVRLGTDLQKYFATIDRASSSVNQRPIASPDRIKVALDLLSSSYLEHSNEARFWTLATAIEILAPVAEKHPTAVRLLDEWRARITELLSESTDTPDLRRDYEALQDEFQFRKESSISSRIRKYVATIFGESGASADGTKEADAKKMYKLRSTLTHTGKLSSAEIQEGLALSRNLITAILMKELTT